MCGHHALRQDFRTGLVEGQQRFVEKLASLGARKDVERRAVVEQFFQVIQADGFAFHRFQSVVSTGSGTASTAGRQPRTALHT